MKNLIRKASAVLFLACLLTTSFPIHADEWWTQGYVGAGLPEEHNVHIRLPDAHISEVQEAIRFSSMALLGIRVSYWAIPYIGLGLDVSHLFGPGQKKQISSTQLCIDGVGCSTFPKCVKEFNGYVTTIVPVVAASYPFDMLRCQIRPYIGAGPSLCICQLQDSHNFSPAGQSSTSTSVGLKTYTGLNVYINQHLGIFLEYQYYTFQARNRYYNCRCDNSFNLGKAKRKETFNMNTVVLGISINYSSLFPQYL